MASEFINNVMAIGSDKEPPQKWINEIQTSVLTCKSCQDFIRHSTLTDLLRMFRPLPKSFKVLWRSRQNYVIRSDLYNWRQISKVIFKYKDFDQCSKIYKRKNVTQNSKSALNTCKFIKMEIYIWTHKSNLKKVKYIHCVESHQGKLVSLRELFRIHTWH